jgi:hypothetical protein
VGLNPEDLLHQNCTKIGGAKRMCEEGEL